MPFMAPAWPVAGPKQWLRVAPSPLFFSRLAAVAGLAEHLQIGLGVGPAFLERPDMVDVGRRSAGYATAVAAGVRVAYQDPDPTRSPIGRGVVGPFLGWADRRARRSPASKGLWHGLSVAGRLRPREDASLHSMCSAVLSFRQHRIGPPVGRFRNKLYLPVIARRGTRPKHPSQRRYRHMVTQRDKAPLSIWPVV